MLGKIEVGYGHFSPLFNAEVHKMHKLFGENADNTKFSINLLKNNKITMLLSNGDKLKSLDGKTISYLKKSNTTEVEKTPVSNIKLETKVETENSEIEQKITSFIQDSLNSEEATNSKTLISVVGEVVNNIHDNFFNSGLGDF